MLLHIVCNHGNSSVVLDFRVVSFFFFNDTATTEIYTLSLHDALPIFDRIFGGGALPRIALELFHAERNPLRLDRKSTRLNSSHSQISYAVFCLKKKKITQLPPLPPDPNRLSPGSC